MNRCAAKTQRSIEENLMAPLRSVVSSHKIIYCLHAPTSVKNPRTGELVNDNQIYSDLPTEADALITCRDFGGQIEKKLTCAQKFSDIFDNNWYSTRALLNQLQTIETAWRLYPLFCGDEFDFFVFARPDLLYLDQFPFADLAPALLGDANVVALPVWHSYGGFNDRFAVASRLGAQAYATRGSILEESCRIRGGLHSESLLRHALTRSNTKVLGLPVRASRVRLTGRVEDEDFSRAVISLPQVGST